ncbi:hypothetical protein N2152v2_001280 [Parachlorella kessleri]
MANPPKLDVALITRSSVETLPEPLDGVVAQFLGGPEQLYYWPREGADDSPPGAALDGGFQGLRYLTGVLKVAEEHKIVELCGSITATVGSSSSGGGDPSAGRRESSQAGVEQQPVPAAELQVCSQPEKGALLVAHPGLGAWFKRSAVLLCHHDPVMGAYGLCLNKPLGHSVRDLTEKVEELGEGGPREGTMESLWVGNSEEGSWARLLGALVGLVGSAPWKLKPPHPDPPPGPLDFPTLLFHTMAETALARREESARDNEAAAEPIFRAHDKFRDPQAADELRARSSAGALEMSQGVSPLAALCGGIYRDSISEVFSSALDRDGTIDVEVDDSEEEEDEGDELSYDDEEDDSSLDYTASNESDGEDEPWQGGGVESSLHTPTVVEVVVVTGESKGARRGPVPRLRPLTPQPQTHPAAATSAAPCKRPAASVTALQKALQAVTHKVTEGAAGDREEVAASEAQREWERREHQPQQAQQQQGRDGALGERGRLLAAGSDQVGRSGGDGGSSVGSSVPKISWLGASAERGTGNRSGGGSSGGSSASLAHLGGSSNSSSSVGVAEGGAALAGSGAPGSLIEADDGSSSAAEPTVAQVLALFAGSQLLRGGPVEGLQILHCRAELGGEPVIQPAEGSSSNSTVTRDDAAEARVFVGGRMKDAPQLVRRGTLSPEDVAVFVGGSGWYGGQLEGELAQGMWALVRADKEVLDLFPEAQRHAHQQQAQQPSQPQHEQQRVGVREGLWERLLAGLGPRHALMARIPLAVWEDLRQLRV